jgi:predicted transcriptional regulator
MMTKEKLIQTIQELPDSFSVEELFDKIILLQKVDIGVQQSNAGQVVTTDEAREKLQKWLLK